MRNKHSKVSDPNTFKTSPGSKFHKSYSSKFNDDGTITLVESGLTDINSKINSHASSCDMSVIVSKLQFGDTSVLTSKKPMYGDFTVFPKTFAECFDLVTRSTKSFEMLSPDIKKLYDNDVAKWFSAAGSDDWLKNMGYVKDVSLSVSESEVVE